MKRILTFTSIRSDYDLMSKLYRLLDDDPGIDLRFVVSGAHLSRIYGYTVKELYKDGFRKVKKFNTLVNLDSKSSRIRAAGLLLIKAIDFVERYAPDLVMCAGDREDIIIAALIAGYLGIPFLHFFGGDHVADGHIDNPVRNAISKLATVHMVSTQEHKRRLIALGEEKKRIFVIGSIALDKFREHTMISKQEIRKKLKITAGFETYALVIFHAIAKEEKDAAIYFENILKTLKSKKINAFVSYPNTDPGSEKIIRKIERNRKDKSFYFYRNLERDLFLSVYKGAEFIIGNSSSGIMEAASIRLPAINVGLRQKERACGKNVVFCAGSCKGIAQAIDKVQNAAFRSDLKNSKNLYGDGKSSRRAYELIKKIDFNSLKYKVEDPEKIDGKGRDIKIVKNRKIAQVHEKQEEDCENSGRCISSR